MNSWKQEMFSSQKQQQQHRELNQTHKKKKKAKASEGGLRRLKLILQPCEVAQGKGSMCLLPMGDDSIGAEFLFVNLESSVLVICIG